MTLQTEAHGQCCAPPTGHDRKHKQRRQVFLAKNMQHRRRSKKRTGRCAKNTRVSERENVRVSWGYGAGFGSAVMSGLETLRRGMMGGNPPVLLRIALPFFILPLFSKSCNRVLCILSFVPPWVPLRVPSAADGERRGILFGKCMASTPVGGGVPTPPQQHPIFRQTSGESAAATVGKGLAPSGSKRPDKRRPPANPQTCCGFAGGRSMS